MVKALRRFAPDQANQLLSLPDDTQLLDEVAFLIRAIPQLENDSSSRWNRVQFDELLEKLISQAAMLGETDPLFLRLTDLIHAAGSREDREILMERVEQLVRQGTPDSLARGREILRQVATRYQDEDSQRRLQHLNCLVSLADTDQPWAAALDAFEQVSDKSSSDLKAAMRLRLERESFDSGGDAEFDTIRQHCEVYRLVDDQDVLTNACWIESIIEQSLNNTPDAHSPNWPELLSVTDTFDATNSRQSNFILYVKSLASFYSRTNADPTQAAMAVLRSTEDKDWLTPRRRRRAAEILVKSSTISLERVTHLGSSATIAYIEAIPKSVADKVFEWCCSCRRANSRHFSFPGRIEPACCESLPLLPTIAASWAIKLRKTLPPQSFSALMNFNDWRARIMLTRDSS